MNDERYTSAIGLLVCYRDGLSRNESAKGMLKEDFPFGSTTRCMFRFFATIVLTMLALTAFAGDKSPPTEREITALIEQLVSPNVVTPTDDCWPEHPPNYDREAQKRVLAAMQELRAMGLPAFPHLLARIDDKRYCLTEDAASCEFAFSVGTICYRTVDTHLQPYGPHTKGEGDPRERASRPNYIRQQKLTTPKVFQTWWKVSKDKTMRDVQIEVLEWTIAEEERRPKDFSVEERKYLKGVLIGLRKSDKALPPRWPFAK